MYLSVSNFTRQRLNSFKVLVLVSLFVQVLHAIAPLKCMEFLIKFVSGLGRMMFSFLLRREFLCKGPVIIYVGGGGGVGGRESWAGPGLFF